MFSTLCYPISLTSSSFQHHNLTYNPKLEQEITLKFENEFKFKSELQPVLILIGGFQGSGKSSLIARIKKAYKTHVISTDSIRQSLLERDLNVSPEFSKYVNNIYINLIRKSLKTSSNILIDANAHSKRIAEMKKLLEETNSTHKVIKIFLKTSEKTLRNRIETRIPTLGCYQGTINDLEAALSSTKINYEDYDLIINTDQLSQNEIFEIVNEFISPYF